MGEEWVVEDTPAPGRARAGIRVPSWRWTTCFVVGAVILYYLVTLFQVVSTGRSDDARRVDAIVVLGAAQYDGRPSPQLAARLDHTVLLWERDLAPYVMVTGGKRPGDRFTEAEASARYLVERGVPVAAILRDDEGESTYRSLAVAAEILLDRGLDEVVLVTDPYHALRTELTAEELDLDAHVSPTRTSVVRGWTSARRHVEEAAGVALGRVIGFERLSGLVG